MKGSTVLMEKMEMGKEIRKIPADQIDFQARPKSPWTKEQGLELWKKSESDGHRKLVLKCQPCGLEFAVFTWRNEPEDKLATHFPYCPECGSKGAIGLIRLDHEIGRIYDAHSNE